MKHKLHTIVALGTSVALLASCSSGNHYRSKDIDAYNVKSVAVLPVQVNYSGPIPKKASADYLPNMLAGQSKAFQRALHDNLLRYSREKKKVGYADFLSVDKTNGLLASKGITRANVGEYDTDSLAKMLGVDAVVTMQVNTNRIMSDAMGMALSTVRNVLFFGTNTDPALTGQIPANTGDLTANAALVNRGKTLWSSRYNEPTDWRRGADDVVYTVTKRMGRNFPF